MYSVGLRGDGISTGFDGDRMSNVFGETTRDDSVAIMSLERGLLTASGLDHTGSLYSLVLLTFDSFNFRGFGSGGGGGGGEDEYLNERGTSIVEEEA